MRMCKPSTVQSAIAALVGLLAAAVPAHAVVNIVVGSATGKPGDTVSIPVFLSAVGEQVGGIANDLTFDASIPVTGDCQVPATLDGGATLSPSNCTVGVDCGIRAVVFSLSAQVIPNASLLYTCSVKIADDAPLQTFPIMCSAPEASTPSGTALSAQCSDGQVQVALPTPTFTPTPTPTPGAPTATPRPGGGGGGGGCEIAPQHGDSLGWPLWICAILPLWLWRRHPSARARS
jgi:hypothetical protein